LFIRVEKEKETEMNIVMLAAGPTTIVGAEDTKDYSVGLRAQTAIKIFPGHRPEYPVPILVEQTVDYVLTAPSKLTGLMIELVRCTPLEDDPKGYDRCSVILRSLSSQIIDIPEHIIFGNLVAIEKVELELTTEPAIEADEE
jgi:hypothetical protein